MTARRRFTTAERRARLLRRHHLGAGCSAPDVVAAAERLVGLHATDPATVFLSARARVRGLAVTDVEAALYDDRTLVKHLCMRRTMFVIPTSSLPIVQAAVSDTVAATQRKRLAQDLERGGITTDGARWLAEAEVATLAALAERGPSTGAQLSRAVPALQTKLTYAPGKSYGGDVAVASRMYTVLAAEGQIVRGRPNGAWTSSQHRWMPTPTEAHGLEPAAALVELVRRWLKAFGPATVADVVWWTGVGVGKIRPALRALDVAEVDLDDGETAVALADDLDPTPDVAPVATLLPTLDPTTMGWQARAWYLGSHGPRLFDRNGNGGPTVWWAGHVVGGWAQRATGEIVFELLDDVGREAQAQIATEAAALETWLHGTVVASRFSTPLERELRS